MDLSFIISYYIPIIVGICLCVGYVIKHSLTFVKNKYIPLIMAILGIVINIWINMGISPDILFTGMVSGLASTGLHQLFSEMINKNKQE